MEHPVESILRERNMTKSDLAMFADVDYGSVSRVLCGRAAKISGALYDAIARLGYDAEAVAAKYIEWRKHKAEEVAKRVVAHG